MTGEWAEVLGWELYRWRRATNGRPAGLGAKVSFLVLHSLLLRPARVGAGLLLPGGSRARVQVESLSDALQLSPVGVSGAGLEASSDCTPTHRFAVRSDE